jgi:DNA-binding transcriptional regulator YdaS (Cro superfamily)
LAKRGPAVNQSDRELVAKAKVVAGDATKLAKRLGMSKQAVSDWGRRRPIPRHARERLERIVRGHAAENESLERKTDDTPWQSLDSVVAGTDLHLAPPSGARRANRARRAWHRVSEDQKNELRNYVRQAALIAVAIKQLLSDDAAQRFIAALSAEVTAHVNNKLLDQP